MAAAAAAESDHEDAPSEADEPAPTSDVEMPDPVDDDDGSDDDKEDKKPEESKKKKSDGKEKGKSTSKEKGKGKGKGKGGVMMPDEWPWEDAKKIFEKPDVVPADEVEVSLGRSNERLLSDCLIVGVEQPRRRWPGPIPSNRKRIQASPTLLNIFFQVVTNY